MGERGGMHGHTEDSGAKGKGEAAREHTVGLKRWSGAHRCPPGHAGAVAGGCMDALG